MSAESILAAFVGSGGHVELRSVPRPKLEVGSIMVKMESSGICGTDLEKLSGAYDASTILGHEVSGVVSESKSDMFREGEKVIPHHHVACGSCSLCTSGAETMCAQFKQSNFDPGGFAEEFRVAKYNVDRKGIHKFEDISFDAASFVEPLGCCIRGLQKALFAGFESNTDPISIRNALIIGSGPIGLLHMELLRSQFPDLRLVAVDISRVRLQFASKFEGAIPLNASDSEEGRFSQRGLKETNGLGFDIVVIATGNPKVFGEAVRSVKKSGRLLLFGAMHKGSTYSLDLQSMLLNELTITSSYATTESEMNLALKMLEAGKLDIEKFVTSKIPLARIDDAMQTASAEGQVKVVVKPT